MIRKILFLFIIFLLKVSVGFAEPVKFSTVNNGEAIGRYLEVFLDSTGKMSREEVYKSGHYYQNTNTIPTFTGSQGAIWVKISILNDTKDPNIFLVLQYFNVTEIELFKRTQNGFQEISKQGNIFPVSAQFPYCLNYIFNLYTPSLATGEYYFKIKSSHPVIAPMFIGRENDVKNIVNKEAIFLNLYYGILLAIFFYNFFLFISTFDRTYFYYILFILLLTFAQLTLSGYSYYYLWSGMPSLNRFGVPLTTPLAGIAAGLFAISFLRTKFYTPKLHYAFIGIIFLYCCAIISSFAGYNYISYQLIDFTNPAAAIISIITSFKIARKGYRPAIFYFISWITLSISLIVFALRYLNILPDNIFTTHIVYIGSALQAILLSFALADKINIYKLEKEQSQAAALKASLENERLIREQNVMLEIKVTERTNELVVTNTQLSKTLVDLKDAQIQLVEAEKMASLGQLTAGIAHEINNPINFVKSNIKPLNLDIDDLFEVIGMYNKLHSFENGNIQKQLKIISDKQEEIDMDFVKGEIKQLIKGIEDGAERTAEIVRGLRTFSRLDESELKVANVHEGLDSTIVLLRNSMPAYLNVIKDFKAEGDIECFPGKLNQVFMNIINNAIQAIEEKPVKDQTESITISTVDIPGGKIQIHIKDTGVGITEEIKHRIFEPFFTTKSVGVGTGLGMAIVFKIIEEHHGKIHIESEPGKGADFILTLPYIHTEK